MKYLILSLLLLSNLAASQNHASRCKKDSLDAKQATGRVNWSAACAGDYIIRMYERAKLPDMPRKKIVPFMVHEWLHLMGKKRQKPMYPIYTSDNATGPMWIAPTAADPNCKVKVPEPMQIYTTCMASCYHPDEEVLFDSGFVPVPEAKQENLSGLMVLGDSSTIGNIELLPKDVHTYVESRTETDHKLVKLTMASGKQLRVTTNHPLLDGEGYMREAGVLQVGDSLLDQTGQPEEIAAIEVEDYFGKVYNLQPSTVSLKGNVIVAGGYLSGSNWYQNGGYSHIGSRILREEIPAELVSP